MNGWLFGCRKFSYLASEALDRPLTHSEAGFVERHRMACDSCRRTEENQSFALNMLRAAAIDDVPETNFDLRLIRRVKVQTIRESFSFWSPMAIGATVAMVLMLAVLQVVYKPTGIPQRNSPSGEAHRVTDSPMIPTFAPDTSRTQ